MIIQISSRKFDKSLLIITLGLVVIGTVMVFSASTDISMDQFGKGTFYFRRHLFRVFIGLIVLFSMMHIDYRILKKISAPLLVFTILVLIATKVSYIIQGNARPARWLNLNIITIQTSDLARFAIILYLATYIDKKRNQIKNFVYGFLPPIVMTSLVMALVIIQPDFSTALIIGFLTVTLLFIGGAKFSHITTMGSVGLAVLVPTMLMENYRVERLKDFLTFGTDIKGMNYQVQQSIASLGNGGLFGVGLGESVGKNLFLPEPHTDFIMSIIGEEFGFIGTFITLTLCLAIFQRAMKISKGCTDVFAIMLVMGISIKMIAYAFINSAVVSGLVPTTGLPMPFISFGGTSLVINLMTIGIMLNVSMAKKTIRHRKGAKILFAQ